MSEVSLSHGVSIYGLLLFQVALSKEARRIILFQKNKMYENI
jgi:uncharacterized membrane protein